MHDCADYLQIGYRLNLNNGCQLFKLFGKWGILHTYGQNGDFMGGSQHRCQPLMKQGHRSQAAPFTSQPGTITVSADTEFIPSWSCKTYI